MLSLGAMALAIFVVANDFTSLSVALPAIERTFHADVSTVQWTINAYALGFGVLTVIGGRFADQLGRRKIFVTGAAIFAGFSLVAAFSPTVGVLIAARAVMAVGGALMWPATLGMTYGLLPEARRGLAGGLILGVVGLGNAAGPLVGGLLTDSLGWRWILGINVPVAAAAVVVVLHLVPESRDEHAEHRIDWPGMALLTGSLVALLLALDIVTTSSWGSPMVVGLLVGSAVLMAAVVVIERRTGPWALIPREVAANRQFRAALVAVLFMSMTFFTALVYIPQFMEKLLGLSALNAGLGMLPLMVVFGASSFVAGQLYERFGGKRVVVAGAACLPMAMLLLSLVTPRSGYLALVPGMLLLGLGTGLFYSAVFTEAISSLDPERASLASGIIYMFQVAGGSVGLGIATTIVASAAGGEARAGGRAGALFVHGLEETFRVSACLAAVGFVISLLWVGGSVRSLAIPAGTSPLTPTKAAAAPELA
jgi:EmrB/QacA subfamily drug resistance transporter